MAISLVLLGFMSLCFASCKAASSCEQKIAVYYLDAAVDMISKAKSNVPECMSCGNNVTRGVLDCSELLQMGRNKSGVYTIWPVSRIAEDKSLKVYCDMQTDGGGWTVIQRRGNYQREKDFFFQDWKSYKEGFGDIEKDFWLGNDNIFALSNQKLYSVRFDLKDVENNSRYAQYDAFWIDDENHKYMFHIADYSGDAGESLIGATNHQKFTTKDQDNDDYTDANCAQVYKGGWWYSKCHHSNLNGLYLRGKHESFADGIHWTSWKGHHESLESTDIKIRPKNFKTQIVSLDTPM